MTDDRNLPPPPPSPARSGCLTVFLIAVGVVLLLPGICALAFVSTGMLNDPTGLALLIVCLAIAAGGVGLIWLAVRRPPS